jgi:hypothetical protein
VSLSVIISHFEGLPLGKGLSCAVTGLPDLGDDIAIYTNWVSEPCSKLEDCLFIGASTTGVCIIGLFSACQDTVSPDQMLQRSSLTLSLVLDPPDRRTDIRNDAIWNVQLRRGANEG